MLNVDLLCLKFKINVLFDIIIFDFISKKEGLNVLYISIVVYIEKKFLFDFLYIIWN